MEVRIRGFGTDQYLRFIGAFLAFVSVFVPYVAFPREGSATLFRLMGMSEALQYPGLDTIVAMLLVVLGAGLLLGVFTKVGGYLVAVGLLYFDLVIVLGIGLQPAFDPAFGVGFYLAVLAALTIIASDTLARMLTA